MNNNYLNDELKIDPMELHAYSTGLLQGKAYSKMHILVSRTVAQYGLSIPEWKLLGQLHENNKIRLSELADLLSYDPPMVTKIAKQLEKKKLVKRAQDSKDERAKVITITPQGSDLIMKIEPQVKLTMAGILQGVTRGELLIYIKVLITIVNNTR